MIHEIAVADAYAIAFEFVKDPSSHGLVNDLTNYQQHPKYANLKPSQYTDDTQRTIATGWAICAEDYYDPASFLVGLRNEFERSPRDGYSRNFQKLIEQVVREEIGAFDFMKMITHRAPSNGSIMGCLPCGFLRTPSEVKIAATSQAIATHASSTVPYAQRLALAAHYFIHNVGEHDDREMLIEFLLSEAEPSRDYENFMEEAERASFFMPPKPDVTMDARRTHVEVLRLLLKHRKLSELLRAAVELGGDTDSVAALAVGLASLSDAYVKDLPEVLTESVEFGNSAEHDHFTTLEETLWMVARGE